MSATYVVRLAKEPGEPAELVGLFVARDSNELYWLIDEVTDPSDCEYARAPNGFGITWADKGSGREVADLDLPDDLGPFSTIDCSGAGLNDNARLAWNSGRLRWQAFESAAAEAALEPGRD